MLYLTVLIATAFALGLADAKRCPKPDTAQNFDPNKYLGTWYEIERFPFRQEDGLKCIQAEYTLNSDGTIKVNNTGIKINNNEPKTAIGKAFIQNEKSKLKVTFVNLGPFTKFTLGNYWVLDTDYKSYTLVYSCFDIFGIKIVDYAWILARSRNLESEKRDKLKAILDNNKIDSKRFLPTDQESC